MREKAENLCMELGKDPLLVQGVGGNVSWKENDLLWIKASGERFSNARKKNFFVPVDLKEINISTNTFEIAFQLLSELKPKPSIETLLHILMPHRIVIHLHAIEVLACLVRKNWKEDIKQIVQKDFSYIFVDYYQPGVDLAQAVCLELYKMPRPEVVFLQNHGIVIGGEKIDECQRLVEVIKKKFLQDIVPKVEIPYSKDTLISPSGTQYAFIKDRDIQQLVFNDLFFNRLSDDWALYPDHVVFLGDKPVILDMNMIDDFNDHSDIIFVKEKGVFGRKSPRRAVMDQLLCYFEVLSRQKKETELITLTASQIRFLLNWDAEKYRSQALRR